MKTISLKFLLKSKGDGFDIPTADSSAFHLHSNSSFTKPFCSQTRTKGMGPAARLTKLQNKCPRWATGACKATHVKVFTYLLQIAMRSRKVPICSEVIGPSKDKKSEKATGEDRSQEATLWSVKNAWTQGNIDRIRRERKTTHKRSQATPSPNKRNIDTKCVKRHCSESRRECYDNFPRHQPSRTPSAR